MTEKPPKAKKPAKRRRNQSRGGRPPYRPTPEERMIVEQMKFVGDPDAVIARALKIDDDTLRKHFKSELVDGHSNRRREITELLFKAAKSGNVTAIKALNEAGKISGAAEAMERRAKGLPQPAASEAVAEPKPAAIGKKAALKEAAARVYGKFAPPSGPRLVAVDGGKVDKA